MKATLACLQESDRLLEVGPDRCVGPRVAKRGEVLRPEAREAAVAPAGQRQCDRGHPCAAQRQPQEAPAPATEAAAMRAAAAGGHDCEVGPGWAILSLLSAASHFVSFERQRAIRGLNSGFRQSWVVGS